jgi:hypothetical protein
MQPIGTQELRGVGIIRKSCILLVVGIINPPLGCLTVPHSEPR